ncbi:MAG: arylsulfatase [Bacteroidota bacterium]
MTTRYFFRLLACLLWLGCAAPSEKAAAPSPPNILLIMADDLGFSDIGAFGSEIQTPNLDRLATQGLRFRTFYNLAKCNPTRSSLLTGLYQGGANTVALPTLLKTAGYQTLMAGKEHFDRWVPDHCYARETFDQSFTFPIINEFFIPPADTFTHPFFLNGRQLAVSEIEVSRPPFHKTDVITDYALRFLDSARQSQQPYFLYLPYHAAHYPLQASPEDIAKYREMYRVGWDEIRANRLERLHALGALPPETPLSPPSENIHRFRGHPKTAGDEVRRANIPLYRPWEELSETEQDELSLEMAVFAAMVDRMDQNIGRLLTDLEEAGELSNTLILFLSDNGSCPYDSNRDFLVPPGPAEGYRTLSAAWANVGNTPFRYFKQYGHEGGPRTHFIAHWPERIAKGGWADEIGHVVDLVPTLLEVASHAPPLPYSLDGRSLLPVLDGKQPKAAERWVAGMPKFRMYREGDWKLVKSNGDAWELYHLSEDPTELTNLALKEPARLQQLEAAYENWQKQMNTRTEIK